MRLECGIQANHPLRRQRRMRSSGRSHVKHIDPQIFSFTQELISSGQIEVKKIESAHNLADLLTKAFPAYTHHRLVQEAGMKFLHKLIST